MRRAALTATFAALSLLATTTQALAQNALAVPVDQSRRVPFNGAAASVITGNNEVAYAYVISPTDVRVVGRKAGLTNLVVLDGGGRTLFEREVAVGTVASGGSTVTIYRGAESTNYACTPACNAVGPVSGSNNSSGVASSPISNTQPGSVDQLDSVADVGQKLTAAAQAMKALRDSQNSR